MTKVADPSLRTDLENLMRKVLTQILEKQLQGWTEDVKGPGATDDYYTKLFEARERETVERVRKAIIDAGYDGTFDPKHLAKAAIAAMRGGV
jgi:predicted kinase